MAAEGICVADHSQNGRTDQKSEEGPAGPSSFHCAGSNFFPYSFVSPC